MLDECTAERLSIMEFDGKMTRADAQKAYEQSQHISDSHYSDKVARLRELATLQRAGRHRKVSGKELAGGVNENT